MRLPVLGLLVAAAPSQRLLDLLVAVSDRCTPVDGAGSGWTPNRPPVPAAYLWCADPVRPPADVPAAVWVRHADDLGGEVARSATVLLCDGPELVARAGERGLLLPYPGWPDGARPVLPFLRRRVRAARGLPDRVTARGEGQFWHWGDRPPAADPPLPDDLADTAAAGAAVVVATGAALPRALAWAAPTVTDPASAAVLGARDGEHVLVRPGARARSAAAADLAGDDVVATRLGWAGHRLARRRYDTGFAAAALLDRLGLAAPPVAGPGPRLLSRLDELGNPSDARPRRRAQALLAGLPDHPDRERP